jgi:hypothetical protein
MAQARVRTVHSSLSAEKNSTGVVVKRARFVSSTLFPVPGAAASSENCPRLNDNPAAAKTLFTTGNGGDNFTDRLVVERSGIVAYAVGIYLIVRGVSQSGGPGSEPPVDADQPFSVTSQKTPPIDRKTEPTGISPVSEPSRLSPTCGDRFFTTLMVVAAEMKRST